MKRVLIAGLSLIGGLLPVHASYQDETAISYVKQPSGERQEDQKDEKQDKFSARLLCDKLKCGLEKSNQTVRRVEESQQELESYKEKVESDLERAKQWENEVSELKKDNEKLTGQLRKNNEESERYKKRVEFLDLRLKDLTEAYRRQKAGWERWRDESISEKNSLWSEIMSWQESNEDLCRRLNLSERKQKRNNFLSRLMTGVSGFFAAGAAWCFSSRRAGQESSGRRALLGVGCAAGSLVTGWLGFTERGQEVSGSLQKRMQCKLRRSEQHKE